MHGALLYYPEVTPDVNSVGFLPTGWISTYFFSPLPRAAEKTLPRL